MKHVTNSSASTRATRRTGYQKTKIANSVSQALEELSNSKAAIAADTKSTDADNEYLLNVIAAAKSDELANAIARGNLEAVSEYGYTPMCFAAHHGNVEAIYALAAAGANIHARAERGMMPAHIAASRDNPEALRALFMCSADMDARCAFGFTPLEWAEMRSWKNPPMQSVMTYISEMRAAFQEIRRFVSI